MPDQPPELLDRPLDYWDRRHQRGSDLRSGGHIGLDEAANELFYAVRLGQLIELMGTGTSRRRPFSVLDAGCGKGYFSGALARAGHDVLGIDPSGAAIDYCRENQPGRYQQVSITGFSSSWHFDVVCCIDVAFHILDEAAWESSLRILGGHVRLGGRLLVTDIWTESAEQRGSYIVHRPHHRYDAVLAPAGLSLQRFRPFGFRENPVGWFLFSKV